jgi:3-(3-hydroxy-phenyl)propionate hydroxylase
MAAEVDVFVAGAGPVGLALASELVRHGVRPRIVDKTVGTKAISKALILHVRTQEIFDAMGVLGQALEQSVPMTNVQVHAYGRRIGQWRFTEAVIDSPRPHPIILGQDRTEKILEKHLATLGVNVEWNTEALGFTQDSDGVSVRVRSPEGREEEIRAKYLVGCEGAHSMTRKVSGLEFSGDAYTGEQFIQADCKIRWELPRGSNYLFLTNVGYMMVIEMPNGIVRIFISLPDDNPSNNDPPTLEDIRSNLVRLSGYEATLSDDVWLARYRTSHRRASTFQKERVFLAGDAGHIHVPIGGQGMNTGLQDAFNLGWKLASVLTGRARPSILKSYDAERVPVAEQLLTGTDKAYRFVLHPGELMKRAVRIFGPFLMSLHMVQERAVSTLEETKIAYHGGPLTEDHGGSNGPIAGERMLDAVAVQWPDMKTVHLFDVARGTKWSALLFAGTDLTLETLTELASLAERIQVRFGNTVSPHLVVAEGFPSGGVHGVLLDREHFLHEKYGVKHSCLYLIRPDWYIAFRGRLKDSEELMAYLDANLIATVDG